MTSRHDPAVLFTATVNPLLRLSCSNCPAKEQMLNNPIYNHKGALHRIGQGQ